MWKLPSPERTRKALKRNQFVVILNGFMIRDCAHFRRFERQLSRQVACNCRLNQFSAACLWVKERACLIGDMSSIYSFKQKHAAFDSANVLLIPALIVMILLDGCRTITSDNCWLAAVDSYTILFLFLCCSIFRSVSMTFENCSCSVSVMIAPCIYSGQHCTWLRYSG